MKTGGFFRLALSDLDVRLAASYIIVLAVSAATLFYAASIRRAVIEEKNLPCELSIAPQGQNELTDESVSEILALDDVVAATGCLQFAVSVSSGDYSASMQLTGIDGSYLDAVFTQGDMFPERSSMPWLVLTLPAARAFTDPNDTEKHDEDYLPAIDWLNADFSISVGDNRIPARVVGIMDSEENIGYLDLATAKQLLQQHGMSSAYTSIAVRIVNIGAKQSVSDAVAELGCQIVDDNDELQQMWDYQLRKEACILLLAIALLVCALLIRIIAGIRDQQQNTVLYRGMLWIGFSKSRVKQMLWLRWFSLDLAGVLLGVVLAYRIPVWLQIENSGVHMYFSTLPFPQVFVGVLMYGLIGMVSAFCISKIIHLSVL